MVLTDAQWAALAPLIEQCRPRGKTPHHDLRRTIEAITWRHQNGAKWRSVPAELGPWWKAAQTFIRWARLGVWVRLLEAAQARGVASRSAWRSSTARASERTRRPRARRERGISSGAGRV
jgi:transposase